MQQKTESCANSLYAFQKIPIFYKWQWNQNICLEQHSQAQTLTALKKKRNYIFSSSHEFNIFFSPSIPFLQCVDTLKENGNKRCKHSQGIRVLCRGAPQHTMLPIEYRMRTAFVKASSLSPIVGIPWLFSNNLSQCGNCLYAKNPIRISKASLYSGDHWRCFACSAHTCSHS